MTRPLSRVRRWLRHISRKARPFVRPAAFVGIVLVVLLLLVVWPAPKRGESDPTRLELFDSEPMVRVLLETLEPGQSVGISAGSLRVVSPEGDVRKAAAAGLVGTPTGANFAGKPLTLPCRFESEGTDLIEIGKRSYEGTLEVRSAEGRVQIINHVLLETYLASVVAAEMGPRFHAEALKAQAVAARSYAVYRILDRRKSHFDLGDDQFSQVYKGHGAAAARMAEIIAETHGQVLSYEGRVLEGLFSSACGGSTRSATEAFGGKSAPPLVGVQCGHCDFAPVAEWTAEQKPEVLTQAIGLPGRLISIPEWERTPGGRLARARLQTSEASGWIASSRLRQALGKDARSALFTELKFDGRRVRAKGRGFGHGVGLCQYGAETLARGRGRLHTEICAFYFPGHALASILKHRAK